MEASFSGPPPGGILGRFENIKEKKSSKRIIPCQAATSEYHRTDFLKPQHLPVDRVDHIANYAPSSNVNETRFHKGFARRSRADIQPDAARLERELVCEMQREDRVHASIQATREHKERHTFNLLTGEGVGRECEFRQIGKRILNPHGCMEATFAEHGKDAQTRIRNSRHRFFEPLPGLPADHRAATLLNEGLTETKRQTATIGYGTAMKSRTRAQSTGASDNYAHLRGVPAEPDWEAPRFGNSSQIVLG